MNQQPEPSETEQADSEQPSRKSLEGSTGMSPDMVVSISMDERASGIISATNLKQAADSLLRHGFVQVNNVYDRAFIDRIRATVLANVGTHEEMEAGSQLVGHARYMQSMSFEGPPGDPMLWADPILLKIMQSQLDVDAEIDNYTCVTAFPDSDDQHIHADHPTLYPGFELAKLLPAYALQMSVPLVDLDDETGTTAIWPGSHRIVFDHNRNNWNYQDSVRPAAKKGSVFIMDFRVVHSGTTNQSNALRPILYLVYARRWFTDYINFEQHIKAKIDMDYLNALPEKARKLLRRFTRVKLLG